MAPEQAQDTKKADARADIYALGCSLYFLLTGKHTYEGGTIMETLAAHREDPIPSLRAVRADVPEPVDAVFQKMVAKKVRDRYQTMTDVIAALDHCVRSGEPMGKSERSLGSSTTTVDLDLKTLLKNVALDQTEAIRSEILSKPPIDHGMKTTLLVGGAALGVMVLLAGVVFTLKTKNGASVATSSEPAAEVPVREKSVVAETAVAAGGKPYSSPAFQQWMKDVAAMPAEAQVRAVSKKLIELNPGFDGKISRPGDESSPPVVEDGNVVAVQIFTDAVDDLSPLRALRELRDLECVAKLQIEQRLDLSPLHGLNIRSLRCVGVNVDLSTVKGLPLTGLALFGGGNTNLAPLTGMPLQSLTLSGTWELTNLRPLKGMPLTYLAIDNSLVADLSPLRGMRLECLVCHVTKVADLSPLEGMPLEELHCDRTLVTDLSPLAGLKLKRFSFTPSPELKGVQVIRQMTSLEHIGTAYDKAMSSDEFWKRYDEGAFGSPRESKPVTDVKSPEGEK